jgi:flagellar assembly protein FliH
MSEMTRICLSDARPLAGFRPWFTAVDLETEVFAEAPSARDVDRYAEGYAAGRENAEAQFASERTRYRALIQSCEALLPEPSDELAVLIAKTVETIVRATVGEVEINQATLVARAKRAAALVSDVDSLRSLHVHPDDLILLDGEAMAVTLVGDPSLMRGSVRMQSATGWIEDGVSCHLELLTEQLGLKEKAL